ncbi:unnamed protein product [Urochloa humidicola]
MDVVVKMEPWRSGFCGAASPAAVKGGGAHRREEAGEEEGSRARAAARPGCSSSPSDRTSGAWSPGRRRHPGGCGVWPLSTLEAWKGFRRGNGGRHGKQLDP